MYSQYRQLLLTSSLIIATVNATTQAACNDIKQALPGKLWLPGQAPYIQENKDYYNSGLVELGPACIALPTSAADVSSIVQILNRHSTVNFAIKSGGHSPNAGDSSIKDGVLIALRHINGTTYDAAKQVAHVKPGGHWSDVVSALSSTGRMVVGGRLGVVGIGGYLMQGGVSFFSAQYGLGGDVRHIVNISC
jgi:FAD/FMN-containing dehydrogenase